MNLLEFLKIYEHRYKMQLTYLCNRSKWPIEKVIQSLVDKHGKVEEATGMVTEREIRILQSYCGKSRLDKQI